MNSANSDSFKKLIGFFIKPFQGIDKQCFLIILGMFYITIFFSSFVMGYKTVYFYGRILCASVFIFPILFPINDSITEIYGAKTSYLMILAIIICEFFFSFATRALSLMPSPTGWQHQEIYPFLTKGFLHISLADSTSLALGFSSNSYFLAKWGKILYGKNFLIRSIGATAIGELIFTISTNAITFFGVANINQTINIIVSDYIFKMGYSLIFLIPNAIIIYKIKNLFPKEINPEYTDPKIIKFNSIKNIYKA